MKQSNYSVIKRKNPKSLERFITSRETTQPKTIDSEIGTLTLTVFF